MAKLKEKEIQQRIQLFKQGYSIDEIAKKCGIQKASIRNWLAKKGYKNTGCPMEKALTPQQCRIVRQFLRTLVYAKNINPDLDLSDFIQQYRKILNGYITRRPYKDENQAIG